MREFLVTLLIAGVIAFFFFHLFPDKLAVVLNFLGI